MNETKFKNFVKYINNPAFFSACMFCSFWDPEKQNAKINLFNNFFRANDTVFGLAGGVFTNNLTRAHRVISQIQVWIFINKITRAHRVISQIQVCIFINNITPPFPGLGGLFYTDDIRKTGRFAKWIIPF